MLTIEAEVHPDEVAEEVGVAVVAAVAVVEDVTATTAMVDHPQPLHQRKP